MHDLHLSNMYHFLYDWSPWDTGSKTLSLPHSQYYSKGFNPFTVGDHDPSRTLGEAEAFYSTGLLVAGHSCVVLEALDPPSMVVVVMVYSCYYCLLGHHTQIVVVVDLEVELVVDLGVELVVAAWTLGVVLNIKYHTDINTKYSVTLRCMFNTALLWR